MNSSDRYKARDYSCLLEHLQMSSVQMSKMHLHISSLVCLSNLQYNRCCTVYQMKVTASDQYRVYFEQETYDASICSTSARWNTTARISCLRLAGAEGWAFCGP